MYSREQGYFQTRGDHKEFIVTEEDVHLGLVRIERNIGNNIPLTTEPGQPLPHASLHRTEVRGVTWILEKNARKAVITKEMPHDTDGKFRARFEVKRGRQNRVISRFKEQEIDYYGFSTSQRNFRNSLDALVGGVKLMTEYERAVNEAHILDKK